jgi:hypothetical protein
MLARLGLTPALNLTKGLGHGREPARLVVLAIHRGGSPSVSKAQRTALEAFEGQEARKARSAS